MRLIEAIRPDVLVKGGDYTEEAVVGAREVRAWGGRVELIPLVGGISTTQLIASAMRRASAVAKASRLERHLCCRHCSSRFVSRRCWRCFGARYISREPMDAVSQQGAAFVHRVSARLAGRCRADDPAFSRVEVSPSWIALTVVVQACYKPLLVTNPHIDEILTLPKVRPPWLPHAAARGCWRRPTLYWTPLRNRHFDFAISPRWDVDEHLATFLCALTQREPPGWL